MAEEKRKRLKLQCPYCEKLYDVTELAPGTKVLCAECDHTMVVPDKMTTRRISEADLLRVRAEEDKRLKSVNLHELKLEGSEEAEAENKAAEAERKVGEAPTRAPAAAPPKKDTQREWIDWGSIRKGKKPEK